MTENSGLRQALLDECRQFYEKVITKLSSERARIIEGCPWLIEVAVDSLSIAAYARLDSGRLQGVYCGGRDRIPVRLVELVTAFLESASIEQVRGEKFSITINSATTVALYADGVSDPAFVLLPPPVPPPTGKRQSVLN